ncbi:MAG: DUF6776 family protein [Pseudomonadota bacterium]
MNDQSTVKPRVVIGPQDSSPKPWVLGGCVLLGAALGAGGALLITRSDEGSAGLPTQSSVQLEAEVESLGRQVAVAERARQVGENAMAELKRSVFELDQQLASQREEVSFYRRLLDAGGSVRGLAVHEFELTPTPSPQVFGYRLVLTQNLKKTRRVDGTLALTVAGVADDRATRLTGTELGLTDPSRAFEFKYYQLLEGRITLPAGFTPMEVEVQAKAKGSKRTIERTFSWQVADEVAPAA